jgi:small-conductance mechanosensitive channel
MQKQFAAVGDAVNRLLEPANLVQVVIVAGMITLAWSIWRLLRPRLSVDEAPDSWESRLREAAWVISPYAVALLLLAMAAGLLHALHVQAHLVDLAVQLTGLLLLVRLGVYLLRVSLGTRARIKGWGTPISVVVWVFLSLHVMGWGEDVIAVLDSIGINTGKTRISVWSIATLIVTIGLFVLAAVWISRWFEKRLARMQGIAPNMRIGLAKFTQAYLVGLSVLVGLNASGLDMTSLNVLSGEVGIGLGFCLQSIAANFVSGFVLLMDRSIKPGDVISFTGTTGTSTEGFGWVQQLRGRYVVVRDRDGVETLVPNQNLITNSVINWSYTDPRVRIKLPVRISYQDDPEVALQILVRSADDHRRVLREPAPVARLMGFGDHGIELELRFWITDPQEGVNNVRSDVNRAIWREFQKAGITIPTAQRYVRLEMLPQASSSRDSAESR